MGHSLSHEPVQADNVAPENWNVHGQYTNVTQWNRRFRSPRAVIDDKKTSLPTPQRESTKDVTLFVGLRLAQGTELYVNPEIDQGFGLSNTMGIAGFPSGTAYKLGLAKPYGQLQRVFSPGYNIERDPVHMGGLRVHAEF